MESLIHAVVPTTGTLHGDFVMMLPIGIYSGTYGSNFATICWSRDFVGKTIDVDVIRQSSPLDRFRNRSCEHLALDGTIVLCQRDAAASEMLPCRGADSFLYAAGDVLFDGITVHGYNAYYNRQESRVLTLLGVVSPSSHVEWHADFLTQGGAVIRCEVRAYEEDGDLIVINRGYYPNAPLPWWQAAEYASKPWDRDGLAELRTSSRWQAFRFRRMGNYIAQVSDTGELTKILWDKGTWREWESVQGSQPDPVVPKWNNSWRQSSAVLQNGSAFVGSPAIPSYLLPSKDNSWSVYDKAQRIVAQCLNDQSSVWSDLMIGALNDSRVLDQNLAMTVYEWTKLKEDLTGYLSTVSNLPKAVMDSRLSALDKAKEGSSAYLGYLYGYRLTLQEAIDMGNRFAQFIENPVTRNRPWTMKSRKTLSNLSYDDKIHASIKFNYSATVDSMPNIFSKAYNQLKQFSAWVTLKDAWDFIPYSFVVDWFVDISSVLEGIDIFAETQNLSLETCIKSTKAEGSIDAGFAYPALEPYMLNSGTVQLAFTSYHRWRESEFDTPPLYPDVGSIPSILKAHWPEGAALIIQQL